MTDIPQAAIEAAIERKLREVYADGVADGIEAAAKAIEGMNWTDHKGKIMDQWDEIRHQVETYKGSDLPRLNFESLLEDIAEKTAAAIRDLADRKPETKT